MSGKFTFGEDYDKNKIKENLSLEQVASLVEELGGSPQVFDNYLISKTICHNPLDEESSYKLYYYDNSHLFQCYTGCANPSFDIYELICKVKNINKQYKTYYKDNKIRTREWELYDAIPYVISFFNFNSEAFFSNSQTSLPDWQYFNKIQKNSLIPEIKNAEFTTYDKEILKYFPRPHILPWEREGISYDVMIDRGIVYDPVNHGIIIPHYDKDNNLIGIRSRTLIKEDEVYGKYRPAIISGAMYNHPLGFNLYNLNNSKEVIKRTKQVIVFEGEKSPLLFASYFGEENDCTVAICGSSFSSHQFKLLEGLNVNEIIIAFDKQFKKLGDDEWKLWTKKLSEINNKYGNKVLISYMFDTKDLLEYKDSPIDKGPDIFMEMYKERIIL